MIFGIFCWLLLGAWADLQKAYDKCAKENELLAFEVALFEDWSYRSRRPRREGIPLGQTTLRVTCYYEERLLREEGMSDEPR